jgi:hypothetical protein
VAHTCNLRTQRSGESRFETSPRQTVHETLSQKRAGGVVQGIGPEFKPQYHKKKKKKKKDEFGVFYVESFIW